MEGVDSVSHVINTKSKTSGSSASNIPATTQRLIGHDGQRKRQVCHRLGGRVVFSQLPQEQVPIRGSIKHTYNSLSSLKSSYHRFSRKRRRATDIETGSDNTIANSFDREPEIPINYSSYPITVNTTEEVNNATRGAGGENGESVTIGEYRLAVGKVLHSAKSQCAYEILNFIGRGSFGQVVKCRKKESNEIVAVKMLKNLPLYVRQGHVEINILSRLNQENADQFNMVKWHEAFLHQGHICLVFEMLAQSLFSFQRRSQITSFPFKYIRPIIQQILTALLKLKEMGIIHLDLKPENIMLVDPIRQPFRVKVIDFGSACDTYKALCGSYAQSRFYRAPEVILGLPFSEAVDMWSLGCITAELRIGCALYPGLSEYDQARYIIETQGLPTNEMLNSSSKTAKFFHRCNNDGISSITSLWRLKTPEEHQAETGVESRETRKVRLNCLEDIGQYGKLPSDMTGGELLADQAERREFVDLVTKMLEIDPNGRIKPEEALNHSFLTMSHLIDFAHYPNVKESSEIMETFRRRENSNVSYVPPAPLPPMANLVPASTVNMTLGFPHPSLFVPNQYVLYGGNVEAHQFIQPSSTVISQPQLIPPLQCPPFCQVTAAAAPQIHPYYVPATFVDQNNCQVVVTGVPTAWPNSYPMFVLPSTEMNSAHPTSQQ